MSQSKRQIPVQIPIQLDEETFEINKMYDEYCQEMKIKELETQLNEIRRSIYNFKSSLTKVGLKKELVNLIIEEGFPPEDISIIDNPITDPLNPESYLVIKYDLTKMIGYLKFNNLKKGN